MPRATQFNKSWLSQLDCNNISVGSWCVADKSDNCTGFCILCAKTVPCRNMGIKQILQHATGLKHMELSKTRFGKAQAHFVVMPTTSPTTSGSAPGAATDNYAVVSATGGSNVQSTSHKLVLAKSHQDQVTAAEVKWILKVVESDMSFRACDGVGELFHQMFPGPISDDFTCNAAKASYIVRFGLGPYFKTALMRDVIDSNHSYTLHYDETTTAQVRKQFDLVVRYWSNQQQRIVVRYFDSLFFGHAQASMVVSSMLENLANNGIPLNRLLCLSSDGPNVNKSIATMINKHLNDAHLPPLVDTGMCNLHVLHNAFGKGIQVFGCDAEKLAIELFYWFKHSAPHREDFKLMQITNDMEETFFVRHLPCRWLTLKPALTRINQLWDASKDYFGKARQVG